MVCTVRVKGVRVVVANTKTVIEYKIWEKQQKCFDILKSNIINATAVVLNSKSD